jgi:hypothetical protein
MPEIFAKPRFVSHYTGVQFKAKPKRYVSFVEPHPIPTVTVGVPTVEETVPGPTPTFIPWIITNPTSIGFYCW